MLEFDVNFLHSKKTSSPFRRGFSQYLALNTQDIQYLLKGDNKVLNHASTAAFVGDDRSGQVAQEPRAVGLNGVQVLLIEEKVHDLIASVLFYEFNSFIHYITLIVWDVSFYELK